MRGFLGELREVFWESREGDFEGLGGSGGVRGMGGFWGVMRRFCGFMRGFFDGVMRGILWVYEGFF